MHLEDKCSAGSSTLGLLHRLTAQREGAKSKAKGNRRHRGKDSAKDVGTVRKYSGGNGGRGSRSSGGGFLTKKAKLRRLKKLKADGSVEENGSSSISSAVRGNKESVVSSKKNNKNNRKNKQKHKNNK